MDLNVVAIVLAAGRAARFGAPKLSARLDGKPVLQHVLDAAADAGVGRVIVVTAPEPPQGVEWGTARLIVNSRPDRGLSSSVQVGWRAAREEGAAAALVLLGDQPLVRADVIRAVVAAPFDPARPIVAIRYSGSGAPNPVRIETAAASLIETELGGDRGLGPLLAAHPELVRHVDVEGDNPDVDTAADLAPVATRAWEARVRGNRDQVQRFREVPDGSDFYASVSSIFRDDPDRTGDAVLDALRLRARATETWLDIGAGAGRYALALARSVREVIALDPSASMIGALRESMAEHGIPNIRIEEGRWPEVSGSLPDVDVSLIAHVGYDVQTIGPFLDAMERVTRRVCLALLMERSPAMLAEPFWIELHGEPRISLPALPALTDLLAARGSTPSVEILESSRRTWTSRDEVEAFVRRQTWVAPGSAKDHRLQQLLEAWVVPADGGVALSVAEPLRVGLVEWSPG
ncbi:MAG TPA: NTP transferase domain-containing protein [Candidatus Limnocylindria bacterium]|nr:NTP transferase domain-containing protein [Candidatus Limnocylindria bacterium]